MRQAVGEPAGQRPWPAADIEQNWRWRVANCAGDDVPDDRESLLTVSDVSRLLGIPTRDPGRGHLVRNLCREVDIRPAGRPFDHSQPALH
jgi:hypothetical protein